MSNGIINVAPQQNKVSPSQEKEIAYLKKILKIIDKHEVEGESLNSINIWIDMINHSSGSELESNLQNGIEQIKFIIEKRFRFVLIKKKRIMLLKRFILTFIASSILAIVHWKWGSIFLLLLVKPLVIVLFVTCLEWVEKKPMKLLQLASIR